MILPVGRAEFPPMALPQHQGRSVLRPRFADPMGVPSLHGLEHGDIGVKVEPYSDWKKEDPGSITRSVHIVCRLHFRRIRVHPSIQNSVFWELPGFQASASADLASFSTRLLSLQSE